MVAFADLVGSEPLASKIDETVPYDGVETDAALRVPPVRRERDLRRRAFFHLLCWWSRRNAVGASVGSDGSLDRISRADGEAAAQADAILSRKDEWACGERAFDEVAVELAIDAARFDFLLEDAEPPYDVPDDYGQYDDEVVAELERLLDLADPDVLADDPVTLRDGFGLAPPLAVEPPVAVNAVGTLGDTFAYTVVLGDDRRTPDDVWRALVGCVLLDDFVGRVEFRHEPPSDELVEIEGLDYVDPSPDGELGILKLPFLVKDIVSALLHNREAVGLMEVRHAELDEVGVYFANRGDLQTVDAERIRQAPGYEECWRSFVEHLLAAADHDGLARVADHFCDGLSVDTA